MNTLILMETFLHKRNEKLDKFTLFEFSAKWDVVPTMLTQCHTDVVNGFMGQTTDFQKDLIKSNVLILGEMKSINTREIYSWANGTRYLDILWRS